MGVSRRAGRPAALSIVLLGLALAAPAAPAATRAPAREALRGADAPVVQLHRVGSVRVEGGTVSRYRQKVGGVSVLGAEAVVTHPAGSPPVLAVDSTTAGIASPGEPRIGAAAALAIAREAVGVLGLRAQARAELVIDAGESGDGTLAWRALLASRRPLGDFEVLIDAASGDVIARRDLIQTRTGRARIFVPNPVVTHGGDHGLHDRRDRNSRLLTKLRRPVRLRNIQARQTCLRGRFVEARIGNGAGQRVCKRGLKWSSVRRASDAFEALMAYFHIDQTQRYIRQLGFKHVRARRQRVFVDHRLPPQFGTQDNSFYSPLTGIINYGFGGVDDAEDADTIVHEYGHAIQDAQARGFGVGLQAGALGEGFGDYLAATMSARNGGTDRDNRCIFDWDGVVWGTFALEFNRLCGRRADLDLTFAAAHVACDPNGEIHCVGQVWSSALMDLRDELTGPVLDRILIDSQFMYLPDEKFGEAGEALVEADAMRYSGSHVAAICAELEGDRGLNLANCL